MLYNLTINIIIIIHNSAAIRGLRDAGLTEVSVDACGDAEGNYIVLTYLLVVLFIVYSLCF